MRNFILGAAAALLAVAAPAVASADTGGMVKFTYAGLDQDNIPTKDSVMAFSGVVLTDLNNGWRVQFNGTASDTDTYGTSFAGSQVEVHAIYDFGQVSVGGYTGIYDDHAGFGFWLVGVEVAGDVGPVHLSASATNGDSTNGAGVSDISNFGVNASMPVMQNLSLYVEGSWSDFGGPVGEIESWGIGGSYAIPNTDFVVGVGYRVSDTEWGAGDMDAIGISFGWRFGNDMGNGYMPGARGLLADGIAWY